MIFHEIRCKTPNGQYIVHMNVFDFLFNPPKVHECTACCHCNSILLPSILYHPSNKFCFEKLYVNAWWTIGRACHEFHFHFDKVILFTGNGGPPATAIALEEKSCMNWIEFNGIYWSKRTSNIYRNTIDIRFITRDFGEVKTVGIYSWKSALDDSSIVSPLLNAAELMIHLEI